jgi:hypothetical protein
MMNRNRIAAALVAVATVMVVTVAACSDRPEPTVGSAVVSTITVAPGRMAAIRRSSDDIRRRIPARLAWIGEEHNRVMLEGITEYRQARRHDPAFEQRMRQDCEWTLAVVARELPRSIARAGMTESEGRSLHERLAAGARPSAVCWPRTDHRGTMERLHPLAIFAHPFVGMQEDGSLTEAGRAVLDQFVAQLDGAASATATYAAIGAATTAAASLNGVDQEMVFSAVSLALGSADLWSEETASGGTLVDEAPFAMALFRRAPFAGQKTFAEFVARDVKGCVAAVPIIGRVTKDWRPLSAGCFLTGTLASLRYFVS